MSGTVGRRSSSAVRTLRSMRSRSSSMTRLDRRLERHLERSGLDAVYLEHVVGPRNRPIHEVPAPTTELGQLLRLGERALTQSKIGLAVAPFGHLLHETNVGTGELRGPHLDLSLQIGRRSFELLAGGHPLRDERRHEEGREGDGTGRRVGA